MKKSILIMASVLAIVAGCAKENLSGSIKKSSGIKVITASIADQTKTYLNTKDGYKLFWFEDETISVGADEQFASFTLIEGKDSPKGKFESAEELPESDYWYAVSPEMTDLKVDGEAFCIKYPEKLTYQVESGCAEGGEIMVAKSADGNFTFHNAIGYIKFQLAVTEEEKITKIEVSGKEGGRIAGPAKVTFEGSEIDTIKFTSDGVSTVTVDFIDPVTITTAEPFVIYIPVAPMAKGISLTVTMQSGKAMTMTSSTPVDINQVIELPVITFAPVTVAKVGETEYYSINQAVQAANELGSDATVTLLGDCNVGAKCEVLSNNSIITIDLAGHTLNSVGDKFFTVASGTKGCVIIDSSEGKTGKITNNNPANSAMKVYGRTIVKSGTIVSEQSYGINMVGGSLVVEGGLVQGGSTGIYIKKDGENTIDSVEVTKDGNVVSTGANGIVLNTLGAKLVFRGGTLQSLKAGLYVYDGKLEVYDGFIGAKSNVVYGSRSSSYNNQIDVYGGFFHRDSTTNAIVYGHLTTDTTRVWGGYFNASPSATYVAEGYEVGSCDTTVNGIQFTSTIVKKAAVACELKIGSNPAVQKATVNEAFDMAKAQSEPATVTLLADCATTDSIGLWAGHNFTLDLNGFTLTTPGTKVFRLNETGAVLTIKSSKEGGMMYESSTGSNSLIVKGGGKCILESGIIKGANTTVSHVYITKSDSGLGGEFIMNGGMIYAPNYYAATCANGKFIMNGGTIQTDKKEEYSIRINGGSAEFNGGNFVSASKNYKVYVSTSATFNGDYENLAASGAGEITFNGGNYTGTTRINGTNVIINGGTFTSADSYAMMVVPGGNVTVNNATFTGATKYGTIRSYGGLILNEGVVVNGTSEDATAIYAGGDDGAGNITVNGGKYTAPKGFYGAVGSISIVDGIFNTTIRAGYIEKAAGVQISGGYFNTPADSVIFTGSGAKGVCQGGWFTERPADSLINSAYLIDDSATTTKEGVDYKYQIKENTAAPDLISVNGTNYKTVDAAISATEAALATGNVTFKVLYNCTTLTQLSANGTNQLTIDLNGKVLSMPILSTAQNLKITDSSADANGKLTNSSALSVVYVKAGTLTFDKGNIFGETIPGVLLEGDKTNKVTFNMTGGNITSTDPCDNWSDRNQGAVSVINNSVFNLSGGSVVDTVSSEGRAINCRHMGSKNDASFSPEVNITNGTVIGYKYTLGGYFGAQYKVSGGNIVAKKNAPVYSGSSSTDQSYIITGGYFVTNYSDGRVYSGYAEKMTKIKGGLYNVATPKFKPNSGDSHTIVPETGFSLQTVDPAEVKVIDGVEYSFVSKVAATN